MNGPLADDILSFLIEKGEVIQSEEISDRFKIALKKTELLIKEMVQARPDLILFKRGYGDSAFAVIISDDQEADIFLSSGGFTHLLQNIEEQREQESERQALEIQKLRLEVNDLKQKPSERKSTRRLAVAAILVSIATLLYELWKTLFFEKS
jgi:hypothetical protein